MNEYQWNISKIKEYYNEVKTLMNKAKTKEELTYIKRHLESYKYILNYYNSVILKDVQFEKEFGPAENPGAIRKEIMNYKHIYPKAFKEMCTNIIYNLDETINFNELYPVRVDLDNESLVKLVGQFLRELDFEFYQILISILENKKSQLHISKSKGYGGICFTDTFKNKPYIHLKNDKTSSSILTLSHEIGHAADFLFNTDDYCQSSSTTSLLCEVPSFLFELLFIDWMKEKGYYTKQMLTAQIIDLNSWFAYTSGVNDVLDLALLSKNYNRKHLKNIYRSYEIDRNSDLNMAYFICFPIALQLRQQYKEDKTFGIYNAKKFMKAKKTNNLDELLEDAQVSLLESAKHVNNYSKELKKALKF